MLFLIFYLKRHLCPYNFNFRAKNRDFVICLSKASTKIENCWIFDNFWYKIICFYRENSNWQSFAFIWIMEFLDTIWDCENHDFSYHQSIEFKTIFCQVFIKSFFYKKSIFMLGKISCQFNFEENLNFSIIQIFPIS